MQNFEKWFPYLKNVIKEEGRRKPYRMFCFHHAGGSAFIFSKWMKSQLPIEFIPVELPGRGMRITESCLTDIDEVIAQFTQAVQTVLDDRPFFFYGHSLGSILAFESAYQLKKQIGAGPEALIVAGRHAPNMPDPVEFRCEMGDEALIEELKRTNGTAPEILENREFLDFFLPTIRSDYLLHESYQYRGETLDIPIIAHSGNQDTGATIEEMQHWVHMTSNSFTLKEFSGDHFFLHNLGENYLQALMRDTIKPDSQAAFR